MVASKESANVLRIVDIWIPHIANNTLAYIQREISLVIRGKDVVLSDKERHNR